MNFEISKKSLLTLKKGRMSTKLPNVLPDNPYCHGMAGMAFGFVARSLQNTRNGFPRFYKPWHHVTSMFVGAFLVINYHKLKNHFRQVYILNELYLGRELSPANKALADSGVIFPKGYVHKTIN